MKQVVGEKNPRTRCLPEPVILENICGCPPYLLVDYATREPEDDLATIEIIYGTHIPLSQDAQPEHCSWATHIVGPLV